MAEPKMLSDRLHRPLRRRMLSKVVITSIQQKHSMKLYDVCTRKIYEKDGEKKFKWYRAGMMKETDKGSIYLRLFHQPQTDFFIFEKQEPVVSAENQTENQ